MESRTLRTRWLAFSLTLVVALTLAACGSESSSSVDSSRMAPAAQQVLRTRLTGEPKSIDPHTISLAAETTLTKPLFAGLFTYDEALRVVPNAAAELPTDDNGGVSKDGLTYTVKLKKDLKWSDGKPLEASDFVYSMQRALDPALAGPYASFYHVLLGAKEYNTAMGTKDAPKTPSAAELEGMRSRVGVTAKDAGTLVYQLKEPSPSFLNLLALWTSFPVRKDVVEKHGSRWTEPENHVGNGAFVLKEWAHDQRMVMEPNPHWQGEKPKLTRLVINFIADDAAAYAAYQADELDVVNVPTAVRREVASPASPLNSQFVKLPALSTYALFFNHSAAPFDNIKVRQAFGMAVDRNAYVNGLLQGAGSVTTSWLPAGMPGYNGDLGKQYEFNAAKAKQTLAEAGYPEGRGLPKVTFIATANDANRLLGQFIEDQIKRNLGVEVTFEYVDSRTFGSRFLGHQYQITIQRWNADWPYPDNWLPEIFGSNSGNNHLEYKNPKFDEIMRRAKAEVDEKKRLALYNDGHKLMLEDAALVPLYNPEVYVLVKPRVKGLAITALDGAIKGDYSLHKAYIAASAD
jgi:oligopeptide transport system substrate-binding protein